MRRVLCRPVLIGCIFCALQSPLLLAQSIPLRLEPLVESNVTTQTVPGPDEDLFDDLSRFLREPLLLNDASSEELKQLTLLADAQIDLLLLHRQSLGALIHLNELQAIAGYTPDLIRQLAPYVRVLPPRASGRAHLLSRSGLTQDFLCRLTGLLTRASDLGGEPWAGSRQRLLVWHRLQTKNWQAGWLVEKDPGEPLLQRRAAPIDHGGFHLFWRGTRLIKTIAVGDFTFNAGQGLLHWQSMAFGKSAEMSWIKRQGPVLRPHRASGEFGFHRGMAVTIGWKPLTITVFMSRRSLSGRVQHDTSGIQMGVISINTSGYHRTNSERQGRNALRQYTAGSRVSIRSRSLELSLNAVHYHFTLPFLRNKDPRNYADIEGRSWYNASIDFSYTRKNLHCFGEGALAANGSKALLAGLIVTPAANVDLFALLRNNGSGYRAMYTNAFSESSSVENEQGFYAGVTLRPRANIRIDAYADHYIFPYLRYRANAPTAGADYLMQLDYRPHKRAAILVRYRLERKWEVATSLADSSQVSAFEGSIREGWRTQLTVQFSTRCRVRTRVEWLRVEPHPRPWQQFGSVFSGQGFLCYADLLFNRVHAGVDLMFRYQYFDTNSYQSRIYALSPDLRPGFGIGAFYGTGHRFWIGLDKTLKNNILISLNGWLGYGAGTLEGRELRLQLRLKLH